MQDHKRAPSPALSPAPPTDPGRDPRVFLVSNRAEQAARIASAVGLVLPCRLIEPGGAWPGGRPFAFVVDLAGRTADETWIETVAERCRAQGVPCLYVARGGPPDPSELRRFGAPTVVSATARTGGIVATLQRLLDEAQDRTGAAQAARARLETRIATASGMVEGLFSAAAARAPVRVRDAEDGTEVVLAAISEAGIMAWLDRLRQHHDGVYQHSLSVAGFAAAFAQELGLNRADRHRLAQAALVHDVGKARIPAAILDKPGPLDAGETAIMRTHAAVGADLLAESGGFEPAILDVVRHHHERLDGSGYPDALTAPDIGDLVRLVAICDVHSALTERRSYRPPMPGRRARAIMEGMRGQLDPHLLRAYGPILARSEGGAEEADVLRIERAGA